MISELDDMPSLAAIPHDLRNAYFDLFNRVRSRNWKMPISASVALLPNEVKLMKEAIATITGSRDISVEEEPNGTFKVKAEGYYNAMCPEADLSS